MPATRFIATSGALSVHAYDAAETVAGQGSVGLEWEEDAPELDTVLVAVGGGGLIAGIAAWYGRRVKVVGVEPEGSRCLHASLEAGRPVDVTVESIAADSLGARNTGQLVFDIAKANVDHVALVTDDAIVAAQRLLWEKLRVAAEPGGAAALAALISRELQAARRTRRSACCCAARMSISPSSRRWRHELPGAPRRGLSRFPQRPPAAGAEPLSRARRAAASRRRSW